MGEKELVKVLGPGFAEGFTDDRSTAQLLREADKDGSGAIDFTEFVRLMQTPSDRKEEELDTNLSTTASFSTDASAESASISFTHVQARHPYQFPRTHLISNEEKQGEQFNERFASAVVTCSCLYPFA